MSPDDLQYFIALLDQHNQLARINVPADPLLEIAAITDRVCKEPDGGQALLFTLPVGSTIPLATNLFGSLRRTCSALGADRPEQLTERLDRLLELIPLPDLANLDRQLTGLQEFTAFTPQTNSSPAWDKIQVRPDLSSFPFLQGWPGDGAATGSPRYITLPQVFTSAPDGSAPNCGMYRCQIHGPRELAVRWGELSGAARHLEAWRDSRRPMPVAIALGGPPATLFSAMFPLPGNLDEMAFAGFLRGEPIPLASCRTVPLQVPATAELVIEGFVDPTESVMEGPFGNHTGFYAPAGAASLLRVSAISRRPGAIIPATVVGAPPMEDCWMAKGWERLLLSFLKRLVPAIDDIHFPLEWTFHQSAVISLATPDHGMVREIADLLWRTPWFNAARLTIFIDAADAGPAAPDLAWRCINLAGSADSLLRDSSGTRLALDATGGGLPRQPLRPDQQIAELVTKRWREYGLR